MKLLKSIICVFLLLCIFGIVYAYLNVDQVIEYRDGKNSNKNITLNEIIIPEEDKNENINKNNSVNDVTINNKIENKNLNIIENKTINKVEDKVIENTIENKVENKTSDKIKKMLDGYKKNNKAL